MSRILKVLLVAFALASCFQADAQLFKRLKPSAATIRANNNKNKNQAPATDENLLTSEISKPIIPDKVLPAVKNAMMQQAEELHNLGYDVKSTRNGEVLIVTIPTDKMFAPNESSLQEVYAKPLLEPFEVYLHSPGKYKLLLAVHTDNTGDPLYTERLSDQRAFSISRWFERNYDNTSALRYYGMGAGDPLVPNTNRANRAKNRRLEIFIVPDVNLIQSFQTSTKPSHK